MAKRKYKRFPSGYGGIVEYGGNRRKPFQARRTIGYTDEGKQKYETLGFFETRQEALDCLAEYNKNPYDVQNRQLTFDQLYNQWSKEHFPKISISGVNGYKTAKNYTTSIDNIRFADLRVIHLQGVIDDCPSYSMRENIRTLFNMLYKYAEKLDIVNKRYSSYIDIGKPVVKYKKEPFSDEEIQKLFDNADKVPFADVALILNYTGMRINELLKIENDKINFEKRYMIGGSKTEAGKDRVIPISKKILPYIKKRYNPENKYLITMNGKRITYVTFVRNCWNPLMEQLEIKGKTPHTTRHTTATMLNNAGVPKLIIKRIVGHSNEGFDVTDRYTHTSIKQLVENIDKI